MDKPIVGKLWARQHPKEAARIQIDCLCVKLGIDPPQVKLADDARLVPLKDAARVVGITYHQVVYLKRIGLICPQQIQVDDRNRHHCWGVDPDDVRKAIAENHISFRSSVQNLHE
jgi:hypothetical protein